MSRDYSLAAGPLTLTFEPATGLLRKVRCGDAELVRGVYPAIRDHNWDTISPVGAVMAEEIAADRFELRFGIDCRHGEVDFHWNASLWGSPEGVIVYAVDGVSRSAFRRNRIGFCVLHPADCAGAECLVEHADGSLEEAHFPRRISPHQPFRSIRSVSHVAGPGLRACVTMEGDVFEMEDQRNWTDASFKTYCTPLDLPFPVLVNPGDRVVQKVTIKLVGGASHPAETRASPVTIALGNAEAPLSLIGAQASPLGNSVSPILNKTLRSLRLAHLRIDLHMTTPAWRDCWDHGLSESASIAVPLEIAVFLGAEVEAGMEALCRRYRDDPPLAGTARWLILGEDGRAVPRDCIRIVRKVLGEAGIIASVVSGTDAFFAELNRNRPPAGILDGICFSLNPQVHAFDNSSLVETLPIQGQCVTDAQEISGLPVSVTPITLRMRWNPNATSGARVVDSSPFDSRQSSPFCAAWTLASIKYLAQANARSMTYHALRGGSALIGADGTPYPVFGVLQAIGEFREGCVMGSTSNRPEVVEGLHLRRGRNHRLFIANLTAEAQHVCVLPEGALLAAQSSRLQAANWTAPIEETIGESPIPLEAHAMLKFDYNL